MTYEAILEKAVLERNFRDALIENPINALKDFAIEATSETIEKLSNSMSKEKFLNFIENIMESGPGGATGYM